MKLDYARAREQRRVNLEIGVLGRGADEHERAILDGVEQRVLLRAVEAVDLVDEQDGALPIRLLAVGRCLDLAAQVRHRAANRRHLDERGARRLGDDVGDGGLARAGRPEQDDGAERVALDRRAQPAARPARLFLPDEFIKRAWPHAHRQRRILQRNIFLYFGEQRFHAPMVAQMYEFDRAPLRYRLPMVSQRG